MTLPAQTSPESRLLARLTREDSAPESRVLSRLSRHAEPGVLSRGSHRHIRTAAARSSSGYSPQRQSGVLNRLLRREGLRPAPGNVGLSSLGTDFVSATPPWLARAEAVPAGESPVRRRSLPKPSAPVIHGWGAFAGVPGSSPVARTRAGLRSRASGISPPPMEAPTFPAASAVPAAPGSSPGLSRRAAQPETSSFEPAPPSPSRTSRAAFSGRPLSRTVAAVHAAQTVAPGPSAQALQRSPSAGARAPREYGSSRNPGRGFSVARAVSRRSTGTDLVYADAPVAAATPAADEIGTTRTARYAPSAQAPAQSSPAPTAAASRPQAAARGALSRAAERSVASLPAAPAAARPARSTTHSPLDHAASRSAATQAPVLSRRHGSGAARRVTTLASASLAMADGLPTAAAAPTRVASSPAASRPLTRQVARVATDLPSAPATPLRAPEPPARATRRSAPTPLQRAIRADSAPAYEAGALGHVAARSESVRSASATPLSSAAGPLARSVARSLPAPHQRRFTPMSARSADFDLAAPAALAARSVTSATTSTASGPLRSRAPAASPVASVSRTATATGSHHRVSPASRALGRVATATAATPLARSSAATRAPGLTTPLAGTPAARAIARFGSPDSGAPSGLSRTRSLTASAELGMIAPLRRSTAMPATDTVLAAPRAPQVAARGAETAVRRAKATARRGEVAPTSAAGAHASRAQTAAATSPASPPRASSSSPVARAFARAGHGAPTAVAPGVPSAAASRYARSIPGGPSFDSTLPSLQGSALQRSVEATGPGRGFSQARRAHRERAGSGAFAQTAPELAMNVAAPSLRREEATSSSPTASRSQPPGARLAARSAAARWTTSEAPLDLAAPARSASPARSTAPTAATARGVSTSTATLRRSRRDLSGSTLSSIAAPSGGTAATSPSEAPRRSALPALSRLLSQSPDLLPAAAARSAEPSAVVAGPGRRAASASAPTAPARRSRGPVSSSQTAELLKRVAALKPGESLSTGDEATLADAGGMVAQAARQLDSGLRSSGSSPLGRKRQALRRDSFSTRPSSLIDAGQLENLVRKELDTLSAPKPSLSEGEIVRLAREALGAKGATAIARAAKKGGAPGGKGGEQKDLDDLLHRLIRRMLIEEQIGGERTLTS